MLIRSIHAQGEGDAGYTLIELLEGIAAIALGMWLADVASSHFEGAGHTIVLWTIRIVGSGIIFLCFLFGFGYLFGCLRKRNPPKTPDRENAHKLGCMSAHRSFRLTPTQTPRRVLFWIVEKMITLWSLVTVKRLMTLLTTLFIGGVVGFYCGHLNDDAKQKQKTFNIARRDVCITYRALTALREGENNVARWQLEWKLDLDIISYWSALTNASLQETFFYQDIFHCVNDYRAAYPLTNKWSAYEMMGSTSVARDILARFSSSSRPKP